MSLPSQPKINPSIKVLSLIENASFILSLLSHS